MPYLFDGYNVYHAANRILEEWLSITPLTLCNLISEDMRLQGERGTVVFDGVQPRGGPGKIEPGGYVKIIYSGPQSDADTRMEELIGKNSAPRQLIVVSSDRQIFKAARRRRAKTMTSAVYLRELIKRRQKPKRGIRDPWEKRHGVVEGNLRKWLKMFGINPDEPGDETDRIKY